MVTKSTPKRFTQTQLTQMFAEMSKQHPSKLSYTIWNNPKDPNSLRLSLAGFKFLSTDLKLKSYKFEFDQPYIENVSSIGSIIVNFVSNQH